MENDFLRECMADVKNVPIDEFNKAFCLVCANRECTRARANTSLFNIRTTNWEKDLFLNIPRLEESNPVAKEIIAKWYSPPSINSGTPSGFTALKEAVLEPQGEAPAAVTDEPQFKPIKPKKSIKKKPKEVLEINSEQPTTNETGPSPIPVQSFNPFLPQIPGQVAVDNSPSEEIVPLGGTIVID